MGSGDSNTTRAGLPKVLGWAAYLACSWTWCIGMFLPVLLVRDYGVWGFVVFAVPNCLGAAVSGIAMGRGREAWFLNTHGAAARWFSLVTMAFQAFFAGWVVTWFPIAWMLGIGAVWLGMAAVVRVLGVRRALIPLALGALAVTLAALGAGIGTGEAAIPTYVSPPSGGLLVLAPVCAFGFALCPYLDLTFWRARASLPGSAGNAAFLVGFLVLFPVCILFTLAYAGRLGDAEEFAALKVASTAATMLLGAHLVVQLALTVMYHGIEVGERAREAGAGARRSMGGASLGRVVLGVALLGVFGSRGPVYHGLAFNEVVYRGFMGFYGLVFPAYVWICVMPSWKGRRALDRRSVTVWLAACVVAAPMFWMGFVERHEIWLAPGLGVVILARLLLRRPPYQMVGASVTVGPDSGEPPEPSGAPVPVHSGPPSLDARAIPERGRDAS